MIILISHMNCITGWNLVVNHAIVNAVKLKTAVFEGVSGVLTRQGKDTYAEKVWKANKQIECQVQSLVRVMESEHDRLSRYSDRALALELRFGIMKLTKNIETESDSLLAQGILNRAAVSLGLSPARFCDSATLEQRVFEASVKRLCEIVEKHMNGLSPEEMERMSTIMEVELDKLSQGEREAIQRFIGSDYLSGETLLHFGRTISMLGIAKVILSGAGFGGFLFLSNTMKAISLLMGVSFPFGAYAAATSILAIVLSVPMLVILGGISGSIILRRVNGSIEGLLAQQLVLTGRWRMIGRELQREVNG